MGVICFSETLIQIRTTQSHDPEWQHSNIFHVLENKWTQDRKCFVLCLYLFLYLPWNCSPFPCFVIILCDVLLTFNRQQVAISATLVDHPYIIFHYHVLYNICLSVQNMNYFFPHNEYSQFSVALNEWHRVGMLQTLTSLLEICIEVFIWWVAYHLLVCCS
jgi:hypothetical protein